MNHLLNHAATLLLFRSILIEGMYDSPTDARACKPLTQPDNIRAGETRWSGNALAECLMSSMGCSCVYRNRNIELDYTPLCEECPSVNKEGFFEFYTLAA